MNLKHIPNAVHGQEKSNEFKSIPINLQMLNLNYGKESNSLKRIPRDPGIAPIPQFFTQEKVNKIKPKKFNSSKKNDFQTSLKG
jgi:hypothetical protein